MNSIEKINNLIEKRRKKRAEILGTARTMNSFRNELGAQLVIDTIAVLIKADRKLKSEIDELKQKVNKLYEQSSS